MTDIRVNNPYFESQRGQYLADVARLDPFQDALPCWRQIISTEQQIQWQIRHEDFAGEGCECADCIRQNHRIGCGCGLCKMY